MRKFRKIGIACLGLSLALAGISACNSTNTNSNTSSSEQVDEKVKSGEWDEDWATAYTTSPLGWGWLTTDHDAKILYKDQWHYDQNGVPVSNK